MKKRCFVLGAGFSKPLGFPLTSGLTELAWEWAYGKIARRDVGAPNKNVHLQTLGILYPYCNMPNEWPDDFEALITVLDEFQQYKNVVENTDSSGRGDSAGHLKSQMIEAIQEKFDFLVRNIPEDKSMLLHSFITWIRDSSANVISFNWDTAIEYSCECQQIRYAYDDKDENSISLAKPHGSLNVIEGDQNCRESLESTKGSVFDAIEEPAGHYVMKAKDASTGYSNLTVPTGVSSIVEPSTRKAYDRPWIQSQWNLAYRLMRKADEIVVIGFSLPEIDYRPRVLLQVTGMANPRRRIKIVAPDADELREKYEKWLGHAEIDIFKGCWTEWFDQEDIFIG